MMLMPHCRVERNHAMHFNAAAALMNACNALVHISMKHRLTMLCFAEPSTTMEYIFVEMQQALMIAHDACHDEHLLQSLHQLQSEHAKRNYLSTQAKGARYAIRSYV